jgi:phosphoribosylformylglycinamidine cyclo-ligase
MVDQKNNRTYADAGVDIDAGNRLVERIKPASKSTERLGSMAGLGGFAGMFDPKAAGFKDPILVGATDGVGTKLRIAIDTGDVSTVGIDLVAMCVNDLICQGAEPLFFLDYFATGKLDVTQAEQVIIGIAEGCKLSGCALIGGETAEMPGMYAKNDFDLAGFAVGAMERGKHLPNGVLQGDILIGLPSSGVHSNGFSLVRQIVTGLGLNWDSPAPLGNKSLGTFFLKPTEIYVKPCLSAMRVGGVHAIGHITGGGLTENVPRMLSGGLGASINLSLLPKLPAMEWLAKFGDVSEEEMLKTFNCGIGMILAVEAGQANVLEAELEQGGAKPIRIGRVVPEAGIHWSGNLPF